MDHNNGMERKQIDFHQGYVLESIYNILKIMDINTVEYLAALRNGVAFYYIISFVDGRSKWRIPKKWPVEIHNQSQGIITFCKLAHFDPDFLSFAHIIAQWTIKNMQDSRGFFLLPKAQIIHE